MKAIAENDVIKRRSLRGRLLLGTSCAVALVFTVAAIVLYLAIRAALIAEFDLALVMQARVLATMVEQDPAGPKLELDPAQLPEYAAREHASLFQIWRSDGSTLRKSASLGVQDLRKGEKDGICMPVELVGGRRGRAVSLAFQPRLDDENPVTALVTVSLAVARDAKPLYRMLARLAWVLAGVSAAATIAAAAVMVYVVRRGLRPADALAADISRISTDDLTTRVRSDDTPVELAPLVDRLNDLLARLQSAVEREKSFTADVAHELRTPLAGLEAALEVCVSRQREPTAYEQTARNCLKTTREMATMVDNLLLLARADAHQLSVRNEPTDLAALLREQWATFADQAEDRQLNVSWGVPDTLMLGSDVSLLRVIARNVMENAVAYADSGGSVAVDAGRVNGSLTMTISNSGSQLAAEDAERVFSRFWRGDAARSGKNPHCGLGLPLCRRLSSTLGGEMTAQSESGRFTVRVELPIGGNGNDIG